MNDRITVADLLDSKYLTNSEVQQLCKGMSLSAYKLLRNNKYASDLNVKNLDSLSNKLHRILVDINDLSSVMFLKEELISTDNNSQAKALNAEFIAVFTAALYMPGYNYRKGLLNKEVLANNFSVYDSLLPSTDLDYYRKVLVDDEPLFYGEAIKVDSNLSNQGRDNGFVYTKKTSAQISVVDDEAGVVNTLYDTENPNKISGFSGTIFLGVLFTTTSLLMIAFVLYFSR